MSYLKNKLSKRNKYWISKDRRLELVHFCLQYDERKRIEKALDGYSSDLSMHKMHGQYGEISTVEEKAFLLAGIRSANAVIEKAAYDTDGYLAKYLIEAVTKGLSYPTLRSKYDLACGSDYYYERYRKFFWLLSWYKGV